MKKIFVSISLVLSLMLGGTSCSDYLDIVPEGTPTVDNAFSNRINSFKFLHTCYSYLPDFSNGSSLGFLAGDEHWLMPKGTGFIDQRIGINAWEIGRGAQNSNSPYQNYWDGSMWKAIRNCNIFLENIHKPLDLDDYERNRWISEVKFLKAYYHFFLLQLYGPIPIMDQNIGTDSDIDVVRRYRDPFDDVVNYIANLLDESLEFLPERIMDEGAEMGRITQPIAKAVKAQLLLLAASPLFNGNVDYAEVKDNQGRAIFPTAYDETKWQRAAEACKDAIEAAEAADHELYYFKDAIKISDATRKLLDIGEAVTERWNQEIIWGDVHNVNNLQTQSMAKMTTGSYYECRSVLGPTLTVAEQFYSSNGVPIDEDNSEFWTNEYPNRYKPRLITDEGNNKYYFELGAETATLHFNREPRFYASLSFDRGTWYGSGYKNDSQSSLGKYRFRRLEISGMRTSEDHSYTGYLNKKVCSYKSNLSGSAWVPYRYAFPIIRLSDLYLMYAEALNETMATPNDEVFKYIDLVRERAGLKGVKESWANYSKYPNKPNTREGMREIIRAERLNELACEGKRFFDMRRWKIELPSQIRGWNIKGENPETFYRVTVLFERPKYSYKDFLWPISVGAIQKDPNLVQNPGW